MSTAATEPNPTPATPAVLSNIVSDAPVSDTPPVASNASPSPNAALAPIAVPFPSLPLPVAVAPKVAAVSTDATLSSPSPHHTPSKTATPPIQQAMHTDPVQDSVTVIPATTYPETQPTSAAMALTQPSVDKDIDTSNPFSTTVSFSPAIGTSYATQGSSLSAKSTQHTVATVFGVLGALFAAGLGFLLLRRPCIAVTRRVVTKVRNRTNPTESSQALVYHEKGTLSEKRTSQGPWNGGIVGACDCCAPDGGILGTPLQNERNRMLERQVTGYGYGRQL
jgi:hypothetical protein